MARLRQLHQEVAVLHHEARDALLLVAHHQCDLALEVRLPDEVLRMLGGPGDPERPPP